MGNMHKIIRKLLRARVFPAWFPQGSRTQPVSALTILWWKTYIYQTEQDQRNIGRHTTHTIVSLFTILEISRWVTCTDYNWSCGSRTCFVRNTYMAQTVWNTLKSPVRVPLGACVGAACMGPLRSFAGLFDKNITVQRVKPFGPKLDVATRTALMWNSYGLFTRPYGQKTVRVLKSNRTSGWMWLRHKTGLVHISRTVCGLKIFSRTCRLRG